MSKEYSKDYIDRCVAKGKAAGGFAAEVAATVKSTGRMSVKQAWVLDPPKTSRRWPRYNEVGDFDMEADADLADAMGIGPWGT